MSQAETPARAAPDAEDAATRLYRAAPIAETKLVRHRQVPLDRRRTAIAIVLVVSASAIAATLGPSPTPPVASSEDPALRTAAEPPPTPIRTAAEPPPAQAAAPPREIPASASDAARLLVHGDLAAALAAYRTLGAARPGEPVFAVLAERLERGVRERCLRLHVEGEPCD